ncbi:YqgU-like beta propeller domain-containing protein [Marinilactibacillus piezotolerans]|uniref:YqgU-like beta propeller domain-containing protein n=1 Tax=Marinilactibacillus piezotolerans TaxID=258723 RepID=UPI0009B0C05A|nr:hypothetical protein [Marinilactibacillus piezotolerans]
MHNRNKLWVNSLFLVLLSTLFMSACSFSSQPEKPSAPDQVEEPEQPFTQIDQSKEVLQKIVGWIGEEEVLVHLGDQETQQLVRMNIRSGERHEIYSTDNFILTIQISPQADKVFLQEGSNQTMEAAVIDQEGEEVRRTPLEYSGYINVDWNHVNEDLLFLSYFNMDSETAVETAEVKTWNLQSNEITSASVSAIEPKWYSSNLFLYMNEEDNGFYIGDIRSEESEQKLNPETLNFFLHQDTVITLSESDINDDEVHLMKEYPFLVSQGALTIPKVQMGDRLQLPYLSQSQRDGMIVGSIPDEPVDLSQNLGSFSLYILNFADKSMEKVIDLPENAPIALSPSERYILYGWQYEQVIDLNDQSEIHTLVSEST